MYEGFGSSVPQEVLDAHGMHVLKLDSDWKLPVQFGTQLEPPFLLAETGMVKAKSIGRVSGARVVDIALQGTAKGLDRGQFETETCGGAIRQAKKALGAL